jgi:acylphosphatase
MPGREIIAGGRVQGIGYRWFVVNCAVKHNVKGYVRNQEDGTVLVIAIGEATNLELFIEDIRNGHHYAHIDYLTVNELTNYSEYEDFTIA